MEPLFFGTEILIVANPIPEASFSPYWPITYRTGIILNKMDRAINITGDPALRISPYYMEVFYHEAGNVLGF